MATDQKLADEQRPSYQPPVPSTPNNRGRVPPPLPPRALTNTAPPPPYTLQDERRTETETISERTENISEQWHSHDPRSSSMQSLHPVESRHDRRTLLLVYIHGFMGNETSFQSFPAHLHNLLAMTLAESHVVHTKIYPRYKSRRAIEFARDDFSKWQGPNDSLLYRF